MNAILLTQYGGSILGPIAKVLGWIMNGIFWVLDKIGIPNIGLAIIIFTIVIYLLLMPFTIKQQKFSKLSAKMNPELQAIQKRYEGKKDNDSMMAMQQETKAVYAKSFSDPDQTTSQTTVFWISDYRRCDRSAGVLVCRWNCRNRNGSLRVWTRTVYFIF